MGRLEGKVALITGGASGIGYEFALGFGREGASLVIADLRGADVAVEKLRGEGFHAVLAEGDVSREADVTRMVQAATTQFGGLDIAVNNAALFSTLKPGPFTDIDAAEWQKVMTVNTLGPFLVAKCAVPVMRKRGGGSIINIASNTVHRAPPGFLHYLSSKGAVVAMTRGLARELGPDNITVNAIAPGFTLSAGVLDNDAYKETFRSNAASARSIKRDQVPEDLVGAGIFLASEDSRFMTGQTLVVDGGTVFV